MTKNQLGIVVADRLRPNKRLKLPAPVLNGSGDMPIFGGVAFRL